MEQDLRRLLDELRAAIDRTGEGQEERDELVRLVHAVEERLKASPTEEEHGRLIAELREAGVRFESDHPVLGGAIRRAVNALVAAGI